MVGCTSKSPPIRYVVVEPIDQKAVDEMIGPNALREKTLKINLNGCKSSTHLARAPRDLKIPKTVPF